jgi:hypothetical protein
MGQVALEMGDVTVEKIKQVVEGDGAREQGF